jgi:hypothetical protein
MSVEPEQRDDRPRERDLRPALAALVVVILLAGLAAYTLITAVHHCTPTIC